MHAEVWLKLSKKNFAAVQHKTLTQCSMTPISEILNTHAPELKKMTTRASTAKAAASKQTEEVSNLVQEATAKVETLVADTQKSVGEQFEKFSKSLEGAATFGQENVDALVKSSEIAAKAAEGIGSEVSSYSKKAFEDGVAAAQELAAAKTMTELFEKQTAYAQSAFEGWMHQASKMNEIYAAATKDITAPIGARVSAATDAMKTFNA